jgi:hypothetical protein
VSAFERVLAEPASLSARRALLVEWDRAADPRAELMRAQLEVWKHLDAPPTAQSWELSGDAAALTHLHGEAWAGRIAELVDAYRFHRGLVAEITISLDRFIELADELYQLAPIQHLNLRGPATRFRELVASPRFAQLVSVAFEGQPSFGDTEAFALAQSRYASRLRWIVLTRNAIGRLGVEALAASPYLANVIYLDLDGNPFNPSPSVWSDGGVFSVEASPYAAELQRAYGRKVWLEPLYQQAEWWPPSRDVYAAG